MIRILRKASETLIRLRNHPLIPGLYRTVIWPDIRQIFLPDIRYLAGPDTGYPSKFRIFFAHEKLANVKIYFFSSVLLEITYISILIQLICFFFSTLHYSLIKKCFIFNYFCENPVKDVKKMTNR